MMLREGEGAVKLRETGTRLLEEEAPARQSAG